MNRFGDPDEQARPSFTLDPKLEERQASRVAAFKAARDPDLARHALGRLEESARRELNLMPGVPRLFRPGQHRDVAPPARADDAQPR